LIGFIGSIGSIGFHGSGVRLSVRWHRSIAGLWKSICNRFPYPDRAAFLFLLKRSWIQPMQPMEPMERRDAAGLPPHPGSV
jgi:hypothetical protein